MKLDWSQIRTNVERCLAAAKKGERGGLRVHCGSAERMLKKTKDKTAKELVANIHRAKTAIDPEKSIEYLEKALELVSKEVPAS